MANPLFEMMMGRQTPAPQPRPQMPQYHNPMQMFGSLMQAMRNPAAFVRQNLPQIPEQAFNDPTGNSVLQYMVDNLGVTQQDVQNAANQMPFR